MATVTLGGSGNWSSTTNNAPWPGGTLPNATDDIIIPTGVTLTVDGDYTIGSAPDSLIAYAIDCQGTGMLTINDTRTLTVKGNVRFNGGTNVRLTINGSGRLYFDTSARTSSPKTYRILNSSTEFTYYLRGDDKDNLATIEADSGGYWYGERTAGGTRLNVLDIQFGKFKRMWDGTAGISALGLRVNRNIAGAAATVDYLVMDECGGPIIMTDTGSGRTFSFDRVFIKNSTAGFYGISLGGFGASNTGTITRSSIDRSPNAQVHTGTTCTETYFSTCPGHFYFGTGSIFNTMGTNNSGSGGDTGILVSGAQNATASAKQQVIFLRGAAGTNDHLANPASATAAITITIDGVIVGSASTAINGDGYGAGTTGAGSKTILQNAIFLANSNGGQSFNPIALLGTANSTVEVDHISFVSTNATPNGVSVGETYAGHAGMVAKFKHSQGFDALVSPPLGTAGNNLLTNMEDTSVAEKFDAASMGDNAVDSAACTSDATAYDLRGTQTTPAIASYYGSLGLVDRYRTIADWAGWWGARVGAAGDGSTTPNADATYANAHLLLSQTYELGLYAGSDMHELMWQYLSRGHIPTTATSVRAAGDDGLTRSPYGAWAPALSALSASSSGASCTTNAADGTLYWVLTSSATAPDWDRIIAGQDHTGASLPAAQKGNVSVSTTSPSWSYSPDPGTYYLHIVHSADATTNGDAAQEAYLRTSAETSSGSITVGGGAAVSQFLLFGVAA